MKTKEPKTEVEVMRELIRESHEVIQEMKEQRRLLKVALESSHKEIDDHILHHLNEAVVKAITEMSDATAKHIELATEKVYKRFDTIADALLGADRANIKAGRPSLEEVAKVLHWIDSTDG